MKPKIFIGGPADGQVKVLLEKEWLPKFGKKENKKDNFKLEKKSSSKSKALGSVGSNSLKNLLDSI
jgi:hypothetical protein